MPALFLYNIKSGLKKKDIYKYKMRLYRAFNKHLTGSGNETDPKVCYVDYLDKSAVYVQDRNVKIARQFFKGMKKCFDIYELEINSKTKI